MLKKPSNKPRAEIVTLATAAVMAHGGPTLARVFYKYDCAGCGSREATPVPNLLPTHGTCAVCGHVTEIRGGGYMLHRRASADVPWDTPNVLVVRKPYESDRGDA